MTHHTKQIKNRAVKWASILLVPLMLLVFIVIYQASRALYLELVQEDCFLEWITFACLFFSGVVSLKIAFIRKRKHVPYVWFFAVLGALNLLASMEEISWGQRVLGIESPDFFQEYSDQNEINIHNVLQYFGRDRIPFLPGDDFKTKHAVGIAMLMYGVILPFAVRIKRIGNLMQRLQVAVPPTILTASFFIGSLMMYDRPSGWEEEIGECMLAICLLLFMMIELQCVGNTPGSAPDGHDKCLSS